MPISRRFRVVFVLLLALGVFFAARYYRNRTPGESSDPAGGPITPGGKLTATMRGEPATFNRIAGGANIRTRVVTLLTQATLLRVNPETGVLEPRLATEWIPLGDGLTWEFRLRENIAFADGTPFTADDVLFTFQALYDPRVGSEMANAFKIGGKPLKVESTKPGFVEVTFPSTYGPGIRILESLPILPKHKLNAALEAGTFRNAWTTASPLTDMTGLGPFVLTEHVAGQRLTFTKNPRFWIKDDRGRQLPYLDTLEVAIVADQNAELLRLLGGASDITNDWARAEDLSALRAAAASGTIQLLRAGVTIDSTPMWFNLAASAEAQKVRPWLYAESFRRAVSHAVNRQAIVDTVFLGDAVPVYGPITPGHGEWHLADLPKTEFDLARARALFSAAGLEDRNGDGTLDDAAGQPARFTVLTQKGHTARERTMAVVQQQLKDAGITLDVIALEPNAIVGAWGKGEYDAIHFGPLSDSADPARNMDFWLSTGGFHFWNPGQMTPSTEWEGQIDVLMHKQAATIDPSARRQIFADVQRIFAAHLPALYFAAQNVTVPLSARVRGATPGIFQPPVLWNAERLGTAGGGVR